MSNATKAAKRSDFKKYFQFMWRSLNIQASWNYERQMNMGFLYGIAPTLDELYQKAHMVEISASGLRESHVHDVIITKEAPNYKVEN